MNDDNNHLSGGRYRLNADGTRTLLERTGAMPCACEDDKQAQEESPAAPATPTPTAPTKRLGK